MDSFTPIEVGDSVRQEMMRNGTHDALVDAEIQLLDYKIDQQFREYPEEKQETPPSELGPVSQAPAQTQPSVAATTPPPVVAQAGAAPAPSAAPAPTNNDPATLAAVLPDQRDQALAARLRGIG